MKTGPLLHVGDTDDGPCPCVLCERDRLAAALREIGNTNPDADETPQDYRKRLQHIARAALAEVDDAP